MNRQMLPRMIVGLTLLSLLLACDVLQPPASQNVRATSVAGTITAVTEKTTTTATLIVKVTPTPTPSPLVTPTKVTPTPTPSPLATSTLGVTVTRVCAQCTITIISAKNEGTRVTVAGGTATVMHPNTHFLVVQVQIERLGDADVEGIGWLRIMMIVDKKVRDRNGSTYACTYSMADRPRTDRTRDLTYYFEVPDNVVVTDLMWLDFPPIPLEIK